MAVFERRFISISLHNINPSSTKLFCVFGAVVATLLTLAVSAEQARAQAAYTTGSVNLRHGPGPRYAKVATLPRGVGVHVNTCRAGWCHVQSRWGQGWMSTRYLRAAHRVRSSVYYDRFYWQPRYQPVYPTIPEYYINRPRRGYDPYDDGPDVAPPVPQRWNPAWGVGPARPPIGSGVTPMPPPPLIGGGGHPAIGTGVSPAQ